MGGGELEANRVVGARRAERIVRSCPSHATSGLALRQRHHRAGPEGRMGHVEKVLGVPHQPTYSGEQYKLGRLFQAYAVAAAEEQARKQGLMVTRQTLPDGRVKLLATGF